MGIDTKQAGLAIGTSESLAALIEKRLGVHAVFFADFGSKRIYGLAVVFGDSKDMLSG